MSHGDIVQLGRHRLMCGDATNPEIGKIFLILAVLIAPAAILYCAWRDRQDEVTREALCTAHLAEFRATQTGAA